MGAREQAGCPGTARLRSAPRLRRDRFCRDGASRRLSWRRRPQDTSRLGNAAAGGPHSGSDLGLLCPRPQGEWQRRHLHRSRRDKNRKTKTKNTKNRKKNTNQPQTVNSECCSLYITVAKVWCFPSPGDFSPCNRLWEERIPRPGWPKPRRSAFPAGAGEPRPAPPGLGALSLPGCHPSFLRITVLPAKNPPTKRNKNPTQPINPATTTTTAWCFLNTLSRDFPPDAGAAPGRPAGGRAAPRLTGSAAWPEPGAGVPGGRCFCTLRCLLESQRGSADAVTVQDHLVFTVTLLPRARARISRISVKQPEHLRGLILNL